MHWVGKTPSSVLYMKEKPRGEDQTLRRVEAKRPSPEGNQVMFVAQRGDKKASGTISTYFRRRLQRLFITLNR